MTKVFKPEPSIVRTAIDEIGSILNVDRIAGESISDYTERLLGTFVKRSSSSYQGMINGINRALGQEEIDAISVNYRAILQGDISKEYIEYGQNYIQNNFFYSGIISGSTVVAVGDTLTDQNADWDEESLRGLTLTIGSNKYEIISNKKQSLKIRGLLSNLVGNQFSIQLDLMPNVLTGLSVRIDNKNIPVAENTSNRIYVNQQVFNQVFSTEFKVTAINPKVEVTASSIYLYKEYQSEQNFQLEKEIPLRGFTKFHLGIVDEINTTYYFEAINLLGHKEKVLSISFKKQSSDIVVTQEVVPAVKYFKLKNSNIKLGSLVFSESSIFVQETEEDEVFERPGNYYVDYSSGAILTSVTPSGNKTVSYVSSSFPCKLISSPAIVNTMADKEVESYLFSQLEVRLYENPKKRFVPSQPTTDMLEYIGELLKVKPQAWG